jgi:hypothetical protein
MTYPVEIWLRGTEIATTREITVESAPEAWTDAAVAAVLTEMLRAVDREKNPEAEPRPVFLRGFSWIVSPSKEGGMLIVIEMQVGAAVAGPFTIGQQELDRMMTRVMQAGRGEPYTM